MRLVPAVLSLLVFAACAGDDQTTVTGAEDPAPTPTSATTGEETRYEATSIVLESPSHGPQLCLGGVEESYPPQCGGPDVVGWDWDAVDGEESANGTTWGSYTVTGTWDGEALTLTEPPIEPQPVQRPDEDRDRFATPCPEPVEGWAVLDPDTTSDAAMEAAIEYARAQPEVGGVWVDQSINPAFDQDPVDESRANDPTRLILNISFTDNLAEHEQAIRERWGGPLCVSEASFSHTELTEIRTEVESEVGDVLYSSLDEVHGRVEIGVTVDDGLQERFDSRYGDGVVDVRAQLRPVNN